MTSSLTKRLLTLNVGSSSLKARLYRLERAETLEVRAVAERIGITDSAIRVVDAQGSVLLNRSDPLPDHAAALGALVAWLRAEGRDEGVCAIGQRVVHGGRRYSEPTVINPEVIDELRSLVPLDTEHLPQTIRVIDIISEIYPGVPQVACFDTAFHRHMPRVAQMFPLQRELWDAGVARYGFHGLSCEYIAQELRALDGAASEGRVIIAHLGNGASLTAVQGGVGLDTTMGLTPTGGLMMGSRSGDLDPGVLINLIESRGLDAAGLTRLVNEEAGLLGMSGSSGDMADLLEREDRDPRAAEAIALFCYQGRKHLGALVTVLGGLDTLVFTAGIGEHAPSIRAHICEGLGYLGLQLDATRNAHHAPVISSDASQVTVRVIPTDEDMIIARHTRCLIAKGEADFGHHI